MAKLKRSERTAKLPPNITPAVIHWKVGEFKSDPVNRPAHYTQGGIETRDFIKAKLSKEGWEGYCRGNTIKYLSRLGMKGDALEDAKKAKVYLTWLIESLEGGAGGR